MTTNRITAATARVASGEYNRRFAIGTTVARTMFDIGRLCDGCHCLPERCECPKLTRSPGCPRCGNDRKECCCPDIDALDQDDGQGLRDVGGDA